MHQSSLLRVQWFVENYLSSTPASVLDVGSYDVNGSYRHLFEDSRFSYTGLDVAAGPNVDIVPACSYQWTEIPDESYDVVISGQAFEHIEFFWITMAEMVRVLKRGGLMCLTAPAGVGRHRYPVDCYRFDTDGMVALARYCNLEVLHASTGLAPAGAPRAWFSPHTDSLLVAKKPEAWAGMLDVTQYTLEAPDIEQLATGFGPEPPIVPPTTTERTKMFLAEFWGTTKHILIKLGAKKCLGS